MSLVSVIIPNYNGAKWLSATLDSCLMQKELLKEIIIVDDFSTDNSLQILNEYAGLYPGLVKTCSNTEKGGNNARNLGYSISKGDYIQWLDADDQLLGDKFRVQLKCFQSDNSIDIVYSDWRLDTYDADGNLIRQELKKCKPEKDFLYELIIDNWSAPHNYLIKRRTADMLFKLKAWDPSTKVSQDREYFTMAAITGARFSYIPGCYSVYNRWNKNSVSADVRSERWKSLDRMFDKFEAQLGERMHTDAGTLSKYCNALNTQRALLNVYGFPSKIKGKLTVMNTEWKLIHGVRTRLKFFLMILFNKFEHAGA